jgi:hypothetical protein
VTLLINNPYQKGKILYLSLTKIEIIFKHCVLEGKLLTDVEGHCDVN